MRSTRVKTLCSALLIAAIGFSIHSASEAQTAPSGAAASKSGGGTPPAGGEKQAPVTPIVAPEAERILRDATESLKAAQQLSFHADINFDDLLPTGQKIELAAVYDVAVRKPDRVYTEYW